MSHSFMAAGLLGGIVALAAGCVPCASRSVATNSARNLIFNPEWSATVPVAVGRTEWPSTVAQTQFGEDVWYEETVVDWQGRFDRSTARDYYRRFATQRTGRARR